MPSLIQVKVHPRAKFNKVEAQTDGTYKIWTTAAPDNGKANVAVTRLLAKELGVRISHLTLKRGHTSRQKMFEVA